MAYFVFCGGLGQAIVTSAVFPTKTWTRVTVTHTAAKQAIIHWNGVAQTIVYAGGGASLSANKKSAMVWLPKEVTRKNNYVGKGPYANHKLFKGKMKDLLAQASGTRR